MFNRACNQHYYTDIHRLCSLKSTRVSGQSVVEFGPILLSGTVEDPAVCCCAPDVPKQRFGEHPKHALYMINRETSWANPFCSRCSYAGSHRQCALDEAWRCHLDNCIGDWHLARKRQHVWRKEFVDVTLCIQVSFDEDQVCICSRWNPGPHHNSATLKGYCRDYCGWNRSLSASSPDSFSAIHSLQIKPWLVGEHNPSPSRVASAYMGNGWKPYEHSFGAGRVLASLQALLTWNHLHECDSARSELIQAGLPDTSSTKSATRSGPVTKRFLAITLVT